jgi:hypothetical protein
MNTEAGCPYWKEPVLLDLSNTVTREQLEAAVADPPHILYLTDLVLGAGATQDCLTRLMCAVNIMHVDNPAAIELVEGLRALADQGNCDELALTVYNMPHGMPIAVLDALCYAISNCNFFSLDIRGPVSRQILPLWMAIPQCRRLWSLYYDDGGFVYDHYPQQLMQVLQVETLAAELVAFEISLSPSRRRSAHAKLKAVLQHLRKFQKLEKLVILMRSQVSDVDIEVMKQFAADPPQALLHFRVRQGREELKFIDLVREQDTSFHFHGYNTFETCPRVEVKDMSNNIDAQ